MPAQQDGFDPDGENVPPQSGKRSRGRPRKSSLPPEKSRRASGRLIGASATHVAPEAVHYTPSQRARHEAKEQQARAHVDIKKLTDVFRTAVWEPETAQCRIPAKAALAFVQDAIQKCQHAFQPDFVAALLLTKATDEQGVLQQELIEEVCALHCSLACPRLLLCGLNGHST